ncbi:MAG: PEP-CTERM sorting domain-containing protein [Pirellulaceae bacterium]
MALQVPASVPEPGTMAILSIGGCLAGRCRSRREK